MFGLRRSSKGASNNKRKKLGLVLGSGGARGLAHIGVIKTLLKHNIPIDYIAGSSAGALVGGLFAAWQDIERIENLASEINYQKFLSVFSDLISKAGLFKGEKAEKFLREQLGNQKIEDLSVPFRAIATNVTTGQREILDKGCLATAIRASSSIPFLFQPTEVDGQLLVDGGICCPLPVDVVRQMGADVVVAVNLYHFSPQKTPKLNTLSVAGSSIVLLLYYLAKENEKGADIVINPQIPYVHLTEFMKGQRYIKQGEVQTEKAIEKIRALL
ncbi:MAG: patatin-like phospholipase family protein [Patescibacteria group bacterium]|jgi:NTE family protein